MRTVIHDKSATEYLVEDLELSGGNFKDLCEQLNGYLDTIPLEFKSSAEWEYYDGWGGFKMDVYYNRPHTEDERLSVDLKETAAELRDKYDRMQQYLKLKEEFEEK